ncbi:MAG: ABC transporter substrate-binding protein [Rhodovibrionaceae bacterium]
MPLKKPITRRTALAGIGAGLAAPMLNIRALRADQGVVYVNSWGGSWTDAERKAIFDPFTEATGIEVVPVTPVSIAKLRAQVQMNDYEWDVSNMNPIEVYQAELEDLVEPLDFDIIDRDKLASNAVVGNSLEMLTIATALVYRTDKFPNGGPQSWADFWDVERFPGPRGLYNRAFTNVAIALLADGVAPEDLYPLDLDRAFNKLDEIKDHVTVWWSQGGQSEQIIRDGEIVMGSMWNARAQSVIDGGAPVEIVWNQAEHLSTNRFVAKGTPRTKEAMQFMEFAVQPKPLAEFCDALTYGPLNPKSLDYLSPERVEVMPTRPEYVKIGFHHDPSWLAPKLTELTERYNSWLAS